MDRGDGAGDTGRLSDAQLSRGTNQIGVRLYNERLVLSLVRRHGSLAKAEIARLTNLSAQTISVIMRQLEADGLLRKEPPQRGKIGQPSVPFSLDPDGAYSLGLKLGRRRADLILMDFRGRVRKALHKTYPYPTPAGIVAFVRAGVRRLTGALTPGQARRIAGLGIATPYELWNWGEEVGAPRSVLEAWRTVDIRAELERTSAWPVLLCNDATAACAAELVFGNPARYLDFLYVFIGSFIGGGIVLNGSLYPGRGGNAGALGSMPVAATSAEGRGATRQLIRAASIYTLERKLIAAGRDAARLWQSPDDWGDIGPSLDAWIEEVAENLALAIVSAISVIDFQAALIDGAFPEPVRARIAARTAERVEALDRQGLSPVEIAAGTIGGPARAIGAASLPLLASFARDRDVLFKESA